jgi:hypothetical protein
VRRRRIKLNPSIKCAAHHDTIPANDIYMLPSPHRHRPPHHVIGTCAFNPFKNPHSAAPTRL